MCHIRSQLPVTYSCREGVLLCAKLQVHGVISAIYLDKDGMLVGSDTEDKLEDEPLFFVVLYEK